MSGTQTNDVLANFLRQVKLGQENAIEIIREALPDGKGERTVLAMQNRAMQPERPLPPQRAESPRRGHVLHDALGLLDYLNRYKSQNTVVFVNVAEQVVTAVLDESAATGREAVTLKPAMDPRFQPWQDLLDRQAEDDGGPLSVEQFAEFVLANRRVIEEPGGRELAMTFSQIRASSKIEMQRGVGVRAVNSLVCSVEIQGQTKGEPVDLPDMILVRCPLYVGGREQDLEFDLLVCSPKPGEVVVKVTAAQLVEARVKAFEEIANQIRSLDGVTVILGHPQQFAWDYLPQK